MLQSQPVKISQADIGRTIRGVSGALYLQSAIARGNSFFEGYFGCSRSYLVGVDEQVLRNKAL